MGCHRGWRSQQWACLQGIGNCPMPNARPCWLHGGRAAESMRLYRHTRARQLEALIIQPLGTARSAMVLNKQKCDGQWCGVPAAPAWWVGAWWGWAGVALDSLEGCTLALSAWRRCEGPTHKVRMPEQSACQGTIYEIRRSRIYRAYL